MQISRLYSNRDDLFAPIAFNCRARANRLNVVFARVSRTHRQGDSHNLGKTTLIHLLEFLLLRNIADTGHFLNRHPDRFSIFVFYLELALDDGTYVTLRRPAATPTSISLKRTPESANDLSELDASAWDHWSIPLVPAREILDAYLGLTAIKPWPYRKGVGYLLRTQEDYHDYFELERFKQGKDREWKAYLAAVLGLNHDAVYEKYVVDELIDEANKRRAEKRAEVQLTNPDRGSVASKIDILRDEVATTSARLYAFDFSREERTISKKVVDEIERGVADLNRRLYDLDADIALIDRSMADGLNFDLRRVRQVFEESRVLFTDSLRRSYEELVDFNRRVTRERNDALRRQRTALVTQRDELGRDQEALNTERQRLLAILQEVETFSKFKALQRETAEKRAELTYLEAQLARIDAVETIDQEIRRLRQARDEYVTAIELSLSRGSRVKTSVTQLFNRFVMTVLQINGEFSVTKNAQGNIEFEIRTKDQLGNSTSQSEGHSYRRLLCALFDLALLKALEGAHFFHFVYHDGILEGLDDRVKLRLLALVRELVKDARLQYIFSTIDSDLPRDPETDKKIEFSADEIVLALHDQGDLGRLFKMPTF